ncbi:MAG: signal peptidase I [Clostridia bacterium]|nr:signal peptidase I [Clostridia bacterium]
MDENQISYEEIDREIEERAAARKKNRPHEIFDFTELVLVTLSIILLCSLFLFRQTVVAGGSMEGTLSDGERLLISDFFYTPKAGDVVVVQIEDDIADAYAELERNEAIIKRVIATEGQTVAVIGGVVYVDGAPLKEDYVLRDGYDSRAEMAPVTVSEGHIFLMGDHRNSSLDSRYFGEVDERTVIGKVLFRILPFSRFGGI